jgi:cysteinyl-tRNA synthetase
MASEKYDAEVVRFFILRAHYRSPLNYSDAHLDDAKGALSRLYTALKEVPADGLAPNWEEEYARRFTDALNDDFNSPVAIAVLFELANEVNKTKSPRLAAQLKGLAGTIGLLQREPLQFLQGGAGADGELDAYVAGQIAARAQAKREKNFAEADRVRQALLEQGIVLEDKPGGVTEWRKA